MGRVILCMGKTAKTPYLLKKIGISIYTAEELCYCIRENTFLMDEEIVSRELIDWLREECGLSELADSLYGFLKTKSSVSAFLTTILEYVGYYPQEEIRRVEQFLKTGAGLQVHERRKRIADYLAGSGKYELALEQYQKLLYDMPEAEAAFRAKLYHNMGYVSSQLFFFEKAAVFFEKAYELSGEKESFLQFLAAKRMLIDEKEYVDFIVGQPQEYCELSMELEKRIEQAGSEWKLCRQAKELEMLRSEDERSDEERLMELEDVGERLKSEYRSMVREK